MLVQGVMNTEEDHTANKSNFHEHFNALDLYITLF